MPVLTSRSDTTLSRANGLLREGRASLARRDYQHAANLIAQAASWLVGQNHAIPQDPRSGGVLSTRYQEMDDEQLSLLLSCCNDVSSCYWEAHNAVEVSTKPPTSECDEELKINDRR